MVRVMHEVYDVAIVLTIVKYFEPCRFLPMMGVGFEHKIYSFSLCMNNATCIFINMKGLAIGGSS